jgi:hypothetical protein
LFTKSDMIRYTYVFPISRDPPEGGTIFIDFYVVHTVDSFQFLGIPPKGEPNQIE